MIGKSLCHGKFVFVVTTNIVTVYDEDDNRLQSFQTDDERTVVDCICEARSFCEVYETKILGKK